MNGRRKHLLHLLIGTICIALSGIAAAQSQPLEMKDAIQLALSNNHSLRADSLDMLITAFKNKETAGKFLPQVNLNSKMDYTPAIAKQMVPGGMVGQPSKELVPVKFGTTYGMGSGIEVSQTIYRKDL